MKAMPEDLSALSDFALLRELRGRGYTVNAGFHAERLVADALGGQLAPKSQKSWDVLANGEKLQVKCRTVSSPIKHSELQLGIFRSFDFDYLVIVQLSRADDLVVRAVKVPRHVVESALGRLANRYPVKNPKSVDRRPADESVDLARPRLPHVIR